MKCKVIITEESASVVSEDVSNIDMWHQRLGHLNSQHLRVLVDRQLACGIKLPGTTKLSFCEGCVEEKMHHKPFKSLTYEQSKRKLGLIHSDMFGPFQVESVGGN